jgi:transposase
VARYRDRYRGGSGAKSDPGDAHVLADLVRTDRHNHRPVAGDSPQAEAVKVLARAQQRLVWARRRQINALRATLREFSPPPRLPSARTSPTPTRSPCSDGRRHPARGAP